MRLLVFELYIGVSRKSKFISADFLKRTIAATLMLTGLVTHLTNAQTFKVKSINGINSEIKVSLDDRDMLKICYLTDTVYIKDCYGFTDSPSILNKQFLKIDYRTRAGSGLDWILTDIFCVKDNKLVQSLHITSIFKEEFIDFRKIYNPANGPDVGSLYKVNLKLSGNNYSDYKMDVIIHDKRKSKEDQHNYNRKSFAALKFDPLQGIFYTSKINTAKYYRFFDTKTEVEKKKYLYGTFSIVKLGSHNYYYVKDNWYEEQEKNYLYKLSYTN